MLYCFNTSHADMPLFLNRKVLKQLVGNGKENFKNVDERMNEWCFRPLRHYLAGNSITVILCCSSGVGIKMLWSQWERDSKKKLQFMEKMWRYKNWFVKGKTTTTSTRNRRRVSRGNCIYSSLCTLKISPLDRNAQDVKSGKQCEHIYSVEISVAQLVECRSQKVAAKK